MTAEARSPRWLAIVTASATVGLVGTLLVGAPTSLAAAPPADCNGSAGVLATPQNSDNGGAPFLTKALSNTVQGIGSTTYFFLIATNRPSGSTFTELLDCAYSSVTGVSTVATYATEQNTPSFSNGQLTIAMTVNANDNSCDRVQLKGTNPGGVAFTDYSNLAGSPSGTSCFAPPPDAPLSASGSNVQGRVAGVVTPATPARGVVASFTDADPGGLTSDFAATIDWGDGTRTTGSISGPSAGPGPRHVSGSHTYFEDGSFTVTVNIHDHGGANATAFATATIDDPANPGERALEDRFDLPGPAQ